MTSLEETGVVFKPIRELSDAVRSREVSPVELVEVFLDRLDSEGPRLNAVVTITRERAIEQAQRAEAEIASGTYRGPLHGIPYGAKDLLATSGGIPTTWGAAPFQDQVFDYDATATLKLEEAGAVLAAKLSMVELAGGIGSYSPAHSSFTGPGINPWDASRWSGGSSSGSGSAVSAGLVPFALGTETWGSILIPASFCGVAGLRPTYGRVSRYGAMALSWTLDKIGPLCLTADDCGLVLDAIAGPDPNDPTASGRPYRYDADPDRRFRLAVLKDATDGAEEAVRMRFENALESLSEVADIDEIELPDLPIVEVIETTHLAESASAFEDFIESGGPSGLTAPEDRYPYARSAVLAKDYIKAQRLRGVIGRAVHGLLSGYDALVAPTTLKTALPLDTDRESTEEDWPKDTVGALGNAAGLPAVSVPSGFSDDGLPTGVQFVGRAYQENAILGVARAYQSLTDWHTRHPGDGQVG